MAESENGFGVRILEAPQGWRVAIVDEAGDVVSERACGDRLEARTYASTVRQHIHWLSQEAFRDYYRLDRA
jgi:hypothetical protein